MHVKYTDDTGVVREWDFRPGRIRASEAQVLERQFGGTWDEFAAGVQSGNMRARTVLLWHLLRQEHPMLAYRDVPDFFTDQLECEYSTEELTEIRASIERNTTMPVDRRESMLTAIDDEMVKAMEREGKAAAPAPTPKKELEPALDRSPISSTPPTDGGSSLPES